MSECLDVIFRRFRSKAHPEVTAIFPSLVGTTRYDMTCYTHIGQHGSCHRDFVNDTRLATPDEYKDLLAELQQIYAPEYTLRVVKRIGRHHDYARKCEMQRLKKGREAA